MRLIAFLLALLAPVPALALSCITPSVERSYAQFDAAEETYVVVHGRITFDPARLPKRRLQNGNPPRKSQIAGELKGYSLSKDGFVLPFDQAVTLEVFCLGPWCGSARNGEDTLAFVRKDQGGYTLAISPCGGTAFGAPKPALLKQVKGCMTKGNCTAER
ncbi:MAG: hypothetical protein AB8B60_03120 [Sulfitobacter sp.]